MGHGSVPAHAQRLAEGRAARDHARGLISGIDDGVLIDGRGSYSIDQQRYNFQFGGDAFWEIKGGKKRGMISRVSYQARTPDFWQACDGIGRARSTGGSSAPPATPKASRPRSTPSATAARPRGSARINVILTD